MKPSRQSRWNTNEEKCIFRLWCSWFSSRSLVSVFRFRFRVVHFLRSLFWTISSWTDGKRVHLLCGICTGSKWTAFFCLFSLDILAMATNRTEGVRLCSCFIFSVHRVHSWSRIFCRIVIHSRARSSCASAYAQNVKNATTEINKVKLKRKFMSKTCTLRMDECWNWINIFVLLFIAERQRSLDFSIVRRHFWFCFRPLKS